jgi:hypothetical protein
MSRKLLGIGALVGGSVLAGLGAYLYQKSKEDSGAGTVGWTGVADRAGAMKLRKESVFADGMTTTVYRGNRLPIRERLGIMQEQIAKSVKDPAAIKLARLMTRHCPDRDNQCVLRAIYDWKRANLRYTGDIAAHKLEKKDGGQVEPVDLFQSAARTAEFGGGDCDDHSIFGSAMGIINGITMHLRVTAPQMSLRENYEHVYELGEVDGKQVPIDSTLPGGDFYGVTPPHVKSLTVIA